MNVLIVNPIPYTSESENVRRAASIKDTMIYSLCLAFQNKGHRVTLFLAEPYKPTGEEEYPFDVIWGKCRFSRLFKVHRIPDMPSLGKYISRHINEIDLIITSEIFALHSLTSVIRGRRKTIIWHELAKHNAMMCKIPSRIWYNIVAGSAMKNTLIVPRSEAAAEFAGRYCSKICSTVIGHGIDINKFAILQSKG